MVSVQYFQRHRTAVDWCVVIVAGVHRLGLHARIHFARRDRRTAAKPAAHATLAVRFAHAVFRSTDDVYHTT